MSVLKQLELKMAPNPPRTKRMMFRMPLDMIDRLDKAADIQNATRSDILFACVNAQVEHLITKRKHK